MYLKCISIIKLSVYIGNSHYLRLLCDPPVDGLSAADTGLDGTLIPFSARGPSNILPNSGNSFSNTEIADSNCWFFIYSTCTKISKFSLLFSKASPFTDLTLLYLDWNDF